MTGLTAQLAHFTATARDRPMPAEAARVIKTGFIDLAAAMLAGRDEPVVGIIRGLCAPGDEASVLFGISRASARDAALINGTAAHALDYDDVGIGGHPSAVLVPAILAEGERLGLPGDMAVRAYLVGYEVWGELIGRDKDPHHVKGWHPTAIFGTVGVAASVAVLNGLDELRSRNAIAIAASLASGLAANFGSMTKPFHAGNAAARGIDAVRMAAAGMTAAADAIEHHAGFLSAVSPAGRVDRSRPADSLGKVLRILDNGISIKKYPMCFATHRVIDGLIDLARKHDLRAEEVAEVHASISPTQASVLRNHTPVTALEAKFSLEFAVAAALVARNVGLAQLTDQFVNCPEVRNIAGKVRIEPVDTSCPIEPVLALHDRVVVVMKDGRRFDSGNIRFARGNAQAALSNDELNAKFIECTQGFEGTAPGALFEALSHLEDLPSLRHLAG